MFLSFDILGFPLPFFASVCQENTRHPSCFPSFSAISPVSFPLPRTNTPLFIPLFPLYPFNLYPNHPSLFPLPTITTPMTEHHALYPLFLFYFHFLTLTPRRRAPVTRTCDLATTSSHPARCT